MVDTSENSPYFSFVHVIKFFVKSLHCKGDFLLTNDKMYRNSVCVYIFCKTKCSVVFLGYVKKMFTLPSISQMTFEQILEIKLVPCQLLLLPICTTTKCGKENKKGAIKVSIKEAVSRYEAECLG
jgi:hypothetical protein